MPSPRNRTAAFALIVFSLANPVRAQHPAKPDWLTFPHTVNRLALSPDGKTIAMTGPEGGLLLFDTRSSKEVWRTEKSARYGSSWALMFSPDGKFVLMSGGRNADKPASLKRYKGALLFYDISKKALTRTLTFADGQGQFGDVVALAGRREVLVGGVDEVAALYDLETGKRTGDYPRY